LNLVDVARIQRQQGAIENAQVRHLAGSTRALEVAGEVLPGRVNRVGAQRLGERHALFSRAYSARTQLAADNDRGGTS
jgi:hypothetical protein